MRRGRFAALGSLAAILVIALIACESGPSEEEVAVTANEEEWAWLEETKATLDAKREELAALTERLASDAAEEGEEVAEEGEETVEELQAKAQSLEQEIVSLSEDFGNRLVTHVNELGISVGGEMTERQLAAVRMKSSEDMALAEEYIEKGGDYQRAISIYEQALDVDPDNEELKAKLQEAQELQFMAEERFAQVKKGMSEKEVRDLLGQVNLRNERDFGEGRKGWFYRKEGGGAAAVYFRQRRGVFQVYDTDFDAVKPAGEEEG